MSTTSATVYGPILPRFIRRPHPDDEEDIDHAPVWDMPLHLATRRGDVPAVLSLLEHGAEIEARDRGDTTALYVAADIGHFEIASLLIERGAQVNQIFENRLEARPRTVLHMAAKSGYTEIVRLLLEHGADVSGRREGYPPPLSWAMRGGHVAVVRLLLERGTDLVVRADDQLSALHEAAAYGHDAPNKLEIVSLLLSFGALADGVDVDERTVLQQAMTGIQEDTAVIRMLLDHGAHHQASTALHSAIRHAKPNVMRLLIERGADVAMKDSAGWTVLHNAVKDGFILRLNNDHEQAELVRLLLDHGADPNWRTSDGIPVIYMATGNGLVKTVSVLLEHGAEVTGLVQGLETVLHRAIRVESADLVHLLIDYGSDRHARDKDGTSAIQLAKRLGHRNVLRVLGLQPSGLAMRDVLHSNECARDDSAGPSNDPENWVSVTVGDWRALAEAHKKRGLMHITNRYYGEGLSEDDIASALAEIDRAIADYMMANSCDPDGVFCSDWLSITYDRRYRLAGDAVDLDMAIEFRRHIIFTDAIGNPNEFYRQASLLLERYNDFSQSPQDLNDAMQLFRACMFNRPQQNFYRWEATWAYVNLCLEYRDAAAAMRPLRFAIDTMLPIMTKPLGQLDDWFLSMRAMRDTLDIAVAVALAAKDTVRAFEWFERGRCMAWRHILCLQTSVDVVGGVDPALAEQLRHNVSQRHIEEHVIENATVGHPKILQSYTRHSVLVNDFEALISKATELPSLKGFLLPKASSELQSTAALGPVVVLNVSERHCDAIILQRNREDIKHVSLRLSVHDCLEHIVNTFRQNLRETDRHIRRDSIHGSRTQLGASDGCARATAIISDKSDSLERILRELWDRVVEPVFRELKLTAKYPEILEPHDCERLPRITWCVSGPLSFLPLHAAGIYDEGKENRRTAFDYAVHSYTPSLSALVEALRLSDVVQRGRDASSHPKILAVSQPATPGHKPLPGTVAEISALQSVAKNRLTWLNNSEATRSSVLKLIDEHTWLHLACHGTQDAEKPTQSAFMLHDGSLSLHSLIRRSSLSSQKSLAVLSACQTATGDVTVPEEVVHLAAGMLMTGFQSVVATMWSIDDYDAPIVMEALYDYLLNKADGDSTQSFLRTSPCSWTIAGESRGK